MPITYQREGNYRASSAMVRTQADPYTQPIRKVKLVDPYQFPGLADLVESEGFGDVATGGFSTGIPALDSVLGVAQQKADKLELAIKVTMAAALWAALASTVALARSRR